VQQNGNPDMFHDCAGCVPALDVSAAVEHVKDCLRKGAAERATARREAEADARREWLNGLRRRREAALRLPPLPGRRSGEGLPAHDPWLMTG
jgi:hypothetical protein